MHSPEGPPSLFPPCFAIYPYGPPQDNFRRRATTAAEEVAVDARKSEDFGWGGGGSIKSTRGGGGDGDGGGGGDGGAGSMGTFAGNSIKLQSHKKKGKRGSQLPDGIKGGADEVFNGFADGNGSNNARMSSPRQSVDSNDSRNENEDSGLVRRNSITITKKAVSMADKMALLKQATGSVKAKPKAAAAPKAVKAPPVPANEQEQFVSGLPSRGDALPDRRASASSEKEPEENVAIPIRLPRPSLVSDTPVDVYIAYLQNEDEAVARSLAARLESDITKSDGSDVVVFFDRVSLDHLWIKAQSKWRKKAAAERMKELISARRYVFIISESAIQDLTAAHREECQLAMEMEIAIEGTRSVVPLFIGTNGTPFRGANLETISNKPTFNEFCKENPRTILSRLMHRPCLKSPSALESTQEMDDVVDAVPFP